MKINKISSALLLAVLAGTMSACGDEPSIEETLPFNFTVSLQSGKTTLEVGETDTIIIGTNGVNDSGKSYTFAVNKDSVGGLGDPVGNTCSFEAKSEGQVIIVVKETTTGKKVNLPITVISASPLANGGKNYASLSGAEAIATRTEILGKLEQYAIDSHLTGITLFENGGYAKYSSRLEIPTEDYITGYGFGILSEGDITEDLAGATAEYKRYYHSAQSSNPGKINAMDDTGSQVSDLAGYITSTYWGTKMNKQKNGYDWYPVLAKDTVRGKTNNRPLPVDANGVLVADGGQSNELGLYNRWRIYVKTGVDVKYRTNGLFKESWDNRTVTIADYEFPIKMLLTGACQLARGSEIAADKTYGIKGAQRFYNNTTNSEIDQTTVDKIWNDMKADGELGLLTGNDADGDYIEFDLLNEIDDFTAMYTLSSALYSPIPEDFVKMLGNGEVKVGAKIYGEAKEDFDHNGDKIMLTPNDSTLSLAPYTLEKWSDEYIAFKQNDTWFERTTYPERHKIKGIKITTYKDANEDPDALYRAFYADALDSCGVPTQHVVEEKNPSKLTENGKKTTRTLVTKGDSTFKLNVNSCTQDTWEYLFGSQGKIMTTGENEKYKCKPWMSNDNFLNGLYWSINRKTFAENRGVQPSINYLSNSYLSDPENGISYNDTDAHKKAISKMHNVDENGNDDYGYNKDKAINYFTKAYSELRAAGKIVDGTKANPTVIDITINWMYQNDINEYGNEIAKYFESAFNDDKVCGGKVILKVDQPNPSSDWQAVYNEVMMKGKFDLAFGAISGNTYNPLNFLEVLKSDNSSGFTLNWGTDTSKVDTKHPLIYNGEKYSFDALWQVADHGGIVENGETVNSIKNCYLGLAKPLNAATEAEVTNELYNGFTVDIPLDFTSVKDVALDVKKVALFVVNGETHNLDYTYDKEHNVIHLSMDATTAAAIDEEIKVAQKNTDPTKKDKYIEHPFTRTYYSTHWSFELTYTLSIMNGTPVANTVTIAMTKDSQKYN